MAEEPEVSQEAQGSYIAQATGGGTATIQVYTSPPSLQNQNRARFLVRLHTRYRDLLSQSLHGAVRLILELAGHPEAVAPPVRLLYQSDQQSAPPFPAGTSLWQVYADAGQELLLLGEPGAGKSSLLLKLAFDLVTQAKQDQSQLLPVIVPLSSWASKRPPLAQWLAEQVALLYDIDPPLSERWVREEHLLPLLDGLDEMEEEARVACIEAINTYHHAHLHPLVVCSRQAEYEAAATHVRLVLHNAVVVQPLTREQVDAYLEQNGEPVVALRTALQENPVLQEIATTPLMLSILILTYQGKAVSALPVMDSLPAQQRQIFATYVERMVARKAKPARAPQHNLVSYLAWLARQMREHHQTIFYLEHLQPDWLAPLDRRRYTWSAVLLPGIVIGVLASVLVQLLLNINGTDSASLLQYAVLGGFLGGLLSQPILAPGGSPPHSHDHSRQNSRRSFGRRLAVSLITGLMVGLSFGWYLGLDYYTLSDWLRDGCIYGMVLGLSSLLLSVWVPLRTSGSASSHHGTARAWKRLVGLLPTGHGQRALLIAALVGIGYGLSNRLSDVLRFGLSYRLSYGLSDVLMIGLPIGLSFGLIGLLLSLILTGQNEGIALTERLQWTWRSLMRSLLSLKHGKMALLFASVIAIGVGLNVGLYYGLNYSMSNGLSVGLYYGSNDGLSAGLRAGLIYWILLGLFQGIVRERIEDSSRQIPNQGIRRSLRNSAIMGLISGGIIGIMSTLSVGVSYVLSYLELSIVLNFWCWLVGASGGLLVCAINGGLATWRHYVIRLLLARSHLFPWRAPQFLEEATTRILLRRVGGGYSFPHRLLLDYFADLP